MTDAAKNIRAVLFDLDGTLLDTAPDMAAALNELLREQRRDPLAFAHIRPAVSHGAATLVRLGFPDVQDAAFEVLRSRYLEIYSGRLAVETQPYEGLLGALDDLEQRGIRWGIVTNKPAWLTEPLLRHLQLLDRPAVLVCGDTLPQRKPHPAQLLHAAQQLGIAPQRCLYIGDAERDVLAARAAGMAVFVALYGYIQPHERPDAWPADGWLATPSALVTLLQSINP